jgi:hypothetical protein
MLILLDQGTPVPLRRFLADHTVRTAHQQGWATLANGDLLTAAEAEGSTCSSRPTRTCDINRT